MERPMGVGGIGVEAPGHELAIETVDAPAVGEDEIVDRPTIGERSRIGCTWWDGLGAHSRRG